MASVGGWDKVMDSLSPSSPKSSGDVKRSSIAEGPEGEASVSFLSFLSNHRLPISHHVLLVSPNFCIHIPLSCVIEPVASVIEKAGKACRYEGGTRREEAMSL